MMCITCVWAGVDSAWEQEKLEARKILINRAESHTSGAPMMIASDHFIQEDEGLRPENALLGVFCRRLDGEKKRLMLEQRDYGILLNL